MSEALLELAGRCEAASGPDRELDREIHFRVYGTIKVHPLVPPPYTCSLDAALPLVPEGWNWGVGPWEDWKDGPQRAWAWCDPTGEDWSDEMNCQAISPALALTAAALRARATLNSRTGDE